MFRVLTSEDEALDPVHGPRQFCDRRLQAVDVTELISLVDPAPELMACMGVIVPLDAERSVGPFPRSVRSRRGRRTERPHASLPRCKVDDDGGCFVEVAEHVETLGAKILPVHDRASGKGHQQVS
jgi:hypothetical protein